MDRLITALFTFASRRSAWILVLSLVLTLIGGLYSIRLYRNLRPNIEELLPTQARSVQDLEKVSNRLTSIENLAVLIFSQNTRASRRFVTDLARELQDAPADLIASVEYRIDREIEFFRKRRTLYFELSDLKKIRDYIEDRIQYEKELLNPLNIFSETEIPEPRLDLRGMQRKYERRTSFYTRFPDGFYASPDETQRVILIYMPSAPGSDEEALSTQAMRRMKRYVEQTIDRLNPRSYASDIEIHYTGGIENTLEEQAALVADLELSTVIVILLVTAAMLVFFRHSAATLALVLSLIMGTLWTFGASYFLIGYLNANSAFLGSIVLGNGINFGTILLARYLEERRKGAAHPEALRIGMLGTAKATSTAALAAGLSYGSLVLTGFRGFRQFGVIGLIGMIFCWISAYTVLPALLTAISRRARRAPRARGRTGGGIGNLLARLIRRKSVLVWMISILATLLSLGTFLKPNPQILETDLTRLRSKESLEEGSAYYSRFVDQIFQRYLSPVIILADTRSEAGEIARELRQNKRKEGEDSLIGTVQTLEDFVPEDQTQKIQILREIQLLLPSPLLEQLSPRDKALAREYLTPEALRPIRIQDLPPLVLNKFTEKDGRVGNLVLVEPPLTREISYGENLIRFVKELREAADSVAPGTPVAGALPLSADMFESISRDGPKATLFALFAVICLVVLLFRGLYASLPVLSALLLGITWLSGFILGFDLKINFLNFIALPITFGIGVDYSVNVFQRFRQEGSRDILKVVRETSGAVGLCSLTTIIGYSSLLIARNQAFVSFGRLAVIGELTCVTAAILSLPAHLYLKGWRRRRGLVL